MDDTRSGEIDNTRSQERFFGESGDESISTPDGADNNRVDLQSFQQRERNKFDSKVTRNFKHRCSILTIPVRVKEYKR